MTVINCTIPIRVVIRGRLTDRQLDELTHSLIASVEARISYADEMIREGSVQGDFRLDAIPEELVAEARQSMQDRIRALRGTTSVTHVLPELARDYAFYFSGDAYERMARDYLERWYPQYVHYSVDSFEDMFRILARDIRRERARGHRLMFGEIVIVTHANAAGGLIIPLARGDRGRSGRRFTPWDLRDLQMEFRNGLHTRFRQARSEAVQGISANTRIIVRGCRFGLSDDGLDALRAFFGGHGTVFAPRGYQGFEPLRIGGRLLQNLLEAFDFLLAQGYIPQELSDLTDAEKRRFMRTDARIRRVFTTEFFLMSDEDYEAYRALRDEGLSESEAAEALKRRPFETGDELVGANVPSGGEFWGLSYDLDMPDPNFDRLSLRQIEAWAHDLTHPYTPRNAALLLRLRAAWERQARESIVLGTDNPDDEVLGNLDDPLYGLLPPTDTFTVDDMTLRHDAERLPTLSPYYDMFEEETLSYARPSQDIQRQAMEAEGAELLNEIAREGLHAVGMGEGLFGRRGYVEPIDDGIRLWNFAVNSAELRAEFASELTAFAERVASQPSRSILIEGHTSTTGSPSSNESLGLQRAQAVYQYLLDAGVDAARLHIVGHGGSQSLQADQQDGHIRLEQAARNRRVELRLLPTDTDL